MAQSLVKNYIHIVSSTKQRQSLIKSDLEQELHKYIGGVCNNLECQVITIGGTDDHLHILCLLSKKIALVKLIEELKSNSSKWIKNKGQEYKNFYWQDGYGAFSINPSEVEIAVNYISNQRFHHTKKTFKDEYRSFLKKRNTGLHPVLTYFAPSGQSIIKHYYNESKPMCKLRKLQTVPYFN